MADAAAESIQQVKVGDRIVNAQPDSSATQTDTVVAIHVTYTDVNYDQLTIATPSGTQTVTSTAEHLYWDATTHTWTAADNLNLGDQLDTPGDGHVWVIASRHYTARQTTYNLTVNKTHTYYVLAGTSPVLVHNQNPLPCTTLGWNKLLGDAYRDHIADYFRQQGMKVFTDAQNPAALTFSTPDGDRIFDIGVENPDGGVWYIETKSGDIGKDPDQTKKDQWLERNNGINITYVFDQLKNVGP